MHLHDMLLRRLREHVEEMHSFFDGLTPEQRMERPSPRKWSLHEIVMHLCEVQDIFVERVAKILTEDKPSIEPYEPDQRRAEGMYLDLNFDERLAAFKRQRTTFIRLLASLEPKQWQREGLHPQVRHYTLEKCVEALMRHEEHHLYQMYNVFFGVRES